MGHKKGAVLRGRKTEHILELARAGETAASISKIVRCHKSNVYIACRRHGVQLKRGRPDLAALYPRIVDLRANGLTWDEIEKIVGVTRTAMRKYLKAIGDTVAVRRVRRFWTPEEEAKLRELWGAVTIESISEAVGRPRPCVYAKARSLKLTGGNHVN